MKQNKSSIGLAALLLLIVAGFAMATPAEAYTYNRQGAVNYAVANAYNDVPGSSYFKYNGGDCTNFISQSLYNGGGMIQVGTQYWSPSAWFYTGTSRSQYSYSWAGVQSFGNFMLSSGRATEYKLAAGTYIIPANVPVQVGDIVQIDGADGTAPDGIWDHTTIIRDLDCIANPAGFDAHLTYHQTNTADRTMSSIHSAIPNAKFRVLLLKNTYS